MMVLSDFVIVGIRGGDITDDGLYLGNLNTDNLEKVLHTDLISKIRDEFSNFTPEVCKNCQFYIPVLK